MYILVKDKAQDTQESIVYVMMDDTRIEAKEAISYEHQKEIISEFNKKYSIDNHVKKEVPLVIVFYLDRDMMQNHEMVAAFGKNMEHIIEKKNFNAISIFMPTDTQERVEILNPQLMDETQKEKTDILIGQLTKEFSLNNQINEPND